MITLLDSKKILIVAPTRLGDAIFTTPTIKILREAKPDAIIDVVNSSKLCEEVYSNNPHIDHLFDASELDKSSLETEYDIILPMQDNSNTKRFLEGLSNVHMIHKNPGNTHHKEYCYRFINKLLGVDNPGPVPNYELYPDQKQANYIDNIFLENNILNKQKIVAIHMGVNRTMRYGNKILKRMFGNKFNSDDARCWSFKNYSLLIKKILNSIPDCIVIITGTPEEQFLSKYISKNDRVINLIGKTSVLELAALFTKCNVLLTADTGPLHVASAMSLSTVSLFGPTEPERAGPHPMSDGHIVINKSKLQDITVDEVFCAIKKFL